MSGPPAGLDDVDWADLDHACRPRRAAHRPEPARRRAATALGRPLMEVLRAWGLPTDHDECRRYARLA